MSKAFSNENSGFAIKDRVYKEFDHMEILVDTDVFRVILFYWFYTPGDNGIEISLLDSIKNTFVPRKNHKSNERLQDNLNKLRNNIELLKTIV